jgi:hypothetical protein
MSRRVNAAQLAPAQVPVAVLKARSSTAWMFSQRGSSCVLAAACRLSCADTAIAARSTAARSALARRGASGRRKPDSGISAVNEVGRCMPRGRVGGAMLIELLMAASE